MHKSRKGRWLTTTHVAGEELDIYRVGTKVVGYKGGTATPSRIWRNMKDFKIANKLLNII